MAYKTQLVNAGSANDDHTGDVERVINQKLNQNLAVSPWGATTLNAGFFAVNADTGVSLGLTALQIIQAAINYAGSNGFTLLVIPNKAVDGTVLIPYSAAGVTFNNAVQMTREGGSP